MKLVIVIRRRKEEAAEWKEGGGGRGQKEQGEAGAEMCKSKGQEVRGKQREKKENRKKCIYRRDE